MATIKTLLADARETDGPLLEIADRAAPYSYRDFVSNAWKSGNLLGHYGVHPGATVTVVVGPKKDESGESELGGIDAADPLYAILGATLLGATVGFDPAEPIDSRAFVGPAAQVGEYDTAANCSVIAYGGPPDDPTIAHFEEEMWSENPVEPPEAVAADDPAIEIGSEQFTHGELLDCATEIAAEFGLGEGDTVVLDVPLKEPAALVVSVLAAISAGATVRVQPEAGEIDGVSLVVTDKGDDRENVVQAATVTERLRDTRRA